MLFHRRQDAQITLDTSRVVIANILLDHLDELVLAGETPAIIAFPFQDTPEALHGTVVNAMRHTRYTLCQTSLLKFMMEYSIGVLKASVTMEQGMGIRVSFNSLSIISPL